MYNHQAVVQYLLLSFQFVSDKNIVSDIIIFSVFPAVTVIAIAVTLLVVYIIYRIRRSKRGKLYVQYFMHAWICFCMYVFL